MSLITSQQDEKKLCAGRTDEQEVKRSANQRTGQGHSQSDQQTVGRSLCVKLDQVGVVLIVVWSCSTKRSQSETLNASQRHLGTKQRTSESDSVLRRS